VLAFVLVLTLLLMTGWYLFWPVAVGGCALVYLRLRRPPRPGQAAQPDLA
jgi:amino acid efflux transporter